MTRDELMDEGFEKALTFEDKYLQPKACFQYGYVAGAEPREKRIAELEKENAELKEQNRELLESCEGATMMYEDLCKAKEIIKTFLGFAEAFGYSPSIDKFITEAEQFLQGIKEND